jgi:hypothetical protein
MERLFKPLGPQLKLIIFILALIANMSGNACAETGSENPSAASKRASYVPEASELMKKLGPASVKIVITKFDVPVAIGSGFFANKDGLLITSRQLLRPVLSDANYKVEIILSDKKVIRDFKVVECGDLLRGDVCALSLSYESKGFFAVAKDELSEGGGASVIGHPRGLDFSMTRGKITKLVGSGQGVEKFEITAPLAPGNSGGPVFDDQGHLLGMATKYSNERPNQHWVIPAQSGALRAAMDSTKIPISLAEARRALQENLKTEMRNRAVGELDPALGFAMRSKPLVGLKGFKEVAMKFDNKILRMTLPDLFDDCGFTQKTRNSTLYTCSAFNDAALLTVQRLPNKGYDDLLSKNGKRVMLPKPLDSVEQMQNADEWDMYAQVLSPNQAKSFYSDVSIAQCQLARTSSLPQAAFSDVPACRFSVSNDTEPGAYSINVWLVKDQYLYAIAMWMNHSTMAEYFSRVPILSVLTARWEKSLEPESMRSLASDLEPKPLPTYKIELPETVSFMGAKIEKGGSQLDLYGKKLLLDRFEEGFIVAVTHQKRGYMPPDFSDVTKNSMNQAAKSLGIKYQNKTMEIESINVSGRPGRLLSVFGTNSKGQDVLVLSGSVFYDDQAFEITQIAVTKDTSETFKEFKTLLNGFKRK